VVQETNSEVVAVTVTVTAMANAHLLYKKIGTGDISVTEFREEIIKGLLNDENV
jgi:hypothetical protein